MWAQNFYFISRLTSGFFYVMKLIQKFPNGEIEVEIEDVLESLLEVGEYVEFAYSDYLIIEKKDKRLILR